MKKDTQLIHTGRNPLKQNGSVNPPIHRTSTVLFPTLKDYTEAEKGKAFYHESDPSTRVDYSYGIAGTPTSFALQQAIADIEGGDHALIYPSGLAAITGTLLAFTKQGDHILVADTVYGPTRRFCSIELKKFGVDVTYYDPRIGEDIASLFQDNTTLVMTETPGSITFELQNIDAISNAAHDKGALVVLDNSWATPLYFQAFEHGADVSIQAGTKYLGGHSDLIFGTVTTTKEHFAKLYRSYKNIGFCVSPEDCYLALRGIRTLKPRIEQHGKAALEIASWLEQHSKVSRVLHPALPSHPQHEQFKRDFTGSTGLFAFILDKQYDLDALSKMIDPMDYFGIGCSWGGYESLILALDPSGSRTATKWDAEGSLIRVYIGLEDTQDLKEDLEKALARL